MYCEEDLLPLAALQHLLFCERQCALIYIEQIWRDNPITLEGSSLHDRVHNKGARREVRGDTVICRGLAVRSLRLGVSGISDVVEFHRRLTHDHDSESPTTVSLSGLHGEWAVSPIEYKRGRPKPNDCDRVQLCAQAICMEEMLDIRIGTGALFYGKVQKRYDVVFDNGLRSATEEAAARLHQLVRTGRTPQAELHPKCASCSLMQVCQPRSTGGSRSARRYLRDAIDRALEAEAAP